MIIPTGGGAMMSAEKSLDLAIEKAGIKKEEIVRIDTTGYGRSYIDSGDDSITEITCHAKGANYLNPNVRTIIDIGGQDIKAISIDGQGAVKNFLMNDKCAAGTGRFLEMMAKTLGLSLEEMSVKGLEWKHNIVISSMCTVFAESEVVSLVAQNKDVADIIHGLNVSVASKVGALAARLGKDHPGEYMMTGGVAKNRGIIQALEEKLGAKLYISAVRWERRYLLMRNVKAVRRKRDEAAGLKHLYRYFRQIFTGRGCGQFVDHSLFIRVFAGFKLVFIGPIKEFFVGGFRVIVISH